MKARVINKNNMLYGREFVVDYLKYDYVASKKENIIVKFDDVAFVDINNVEKAIIEHRDILKIQCPKAIDGIFYQILIDAIIEHFGDNFINIDIVEDDYKELKRVWEKNIVAVVDGKPIKINVVGIYKERVLDVKIENIKVDNFINICMTKQRVIKKEIAQRQMQLDCINNALYKVV